MLSGPAQAAHQEWDKGKSKLGPLRSARSEDRPRAITGTDTAEIISGPAWAARHQGKMIDEPPVESFHTGRPACQNGNKGQITIPILGLGSRTPNPEPKEKEKKSNRQNYR